MQTEVVEVWLVCASLPRFWTDMQADVPAVCPLGTLDHSAGGPAPRLAARPGPDAYLKVQWARCGLKAKLCSLLVVSTSWFLPVLLRMCCAGVGFAVHTRGGVGRDLLHNSASVLMQRPRKPSPLLGFAAVQKKQREGSWLWLFGV